MNQYNLDNAIYDSYYRKENAINTLNEKQREAFLSLIGKGCRANTKEKLFKITSAIITMEKIWHLFTSYLN